MTRPAAGSDGNRAGMFAAFRYYWKTAAGYRLRPWKSPYLQWRLETYFGKRARAQNARSFFALLWRERQQMKHFLDWVEERRREQAARRES